MMKRITSAILFFSFLILSCSKNIMISHQMTLVIEDGTDIKQILDPYNQKVYCVSMEKDGIFFLIEVRNPMKPVKILSDQITIEDKNFVTPDGLRVNDKLEEFNTDGKYKVDIICNNVKIVELSSGWDAYLRIDDTILFFRKKINEKISISYKELFNVQNWFDECSLFRTYFPLKKDSINVLYRLEKPFKIQFNPSGSFIKTSSPDFSPCLDIHTGDSLYDVEKRTNMKLQILDSRVGVMALPSEWIACFGNINTDEKNHVIEYFYHYAH